MISFIHYGYIFKSGLNLNVSHSILGSAKVEMYPCLVAVVETNCISTLFNLLMIHNDLLFPLILHGPLCLPSPWLWRIISVVKFCDKLICSLSFLEL